jgi:Yip1 domain
MYYHFTCFRLDKGEINMNLVERAKNILLQPKQEWPVIDAEATSVGDLYRNYIAILAAVPVVAAFIGTSIVGISLPGMGSLRIPFGAGVTRMIMSYVLGLVGVYILALIINALAPSFAGQKNFLQALKVAAYSSTASWLAGIFAVLPLLGILGLLGLYSLYLIYTGLPTLMKTPADKALSYTVVVIVCAIVLFILIGALSSLFMPFPAPQPAR